MATTQHTEELVTEAESFFTYDDSTCDDEDEVEWLQEDLDDMVTEEMRDIQGEHARYMQWDVNVHNFGWRHTNGEGVVRADTGRDLIGKVLPRTQCMFTLYRCTDSTGRKGIVINNAHHDAPMGGEMYYIFEHVEEEEEEGTTWQKRLG